MLRSRVNAAWGAVGVASLVARGQTARALSTIPIRGVSRMVRLKVNGEADAVKAEAILHRVHSALKGTKGYLGSSRFICKAEWDVFLWTRFADLDSLKAYLGSDLKIKKIDPILKELDVLAVGGPVHQQNFTAEDW